MSRLTIQEGSAGAEHSFSFQSILWNNHENTIKREPEITDPLYKDLNIDQIITAVTSGREEYALASFFYAPLKKSDTVLYRQEVFRDFENRKLLDAVISFSEKMSTMRRYKRLAESLDYVYHKEGWFLEAVSLYCDAVVHFVQDLITIDVKSHGFILFREYLDTYVRSEEFQLLREETKKIKKELSSIQYCVLLKRNGCSVSKYEGEIDYSAEVENIFEKFNQGVEKNYSVALRDGTGMNYVEAKILEMVVRLYPGIFKGLEIFFRKNGMFLDKKIVSFDREVQFYVSYLEYISTIKQSGLNFCYPGISTVDKTVSAYETFDLALACRLIEKNVPVVCNDFFLEGEERIIVVSGPNQGGKTTFARTFGQLHYLASLGCPVPGRRAGLFLFDRIFTHFEKQEDISNLRGKLQDDLVRMNRIFTEAGPDSIIIMNEIFTSTTLEDGLFLSKEIMKRIIQLDALCVLVTFMDELSLLSRKTVSMVSMVVPENPALRTFKIVRKPPDGLAYAQSIAEKYRLTYRLLKERIQS